MRVRILHRDPFAQTSASPGAELTEVYAYDDTTSVDDMTACEAAFRMANIGDDPAFGTPDPRAVRYRLRGLRSLMAGDVVVCDTLFYRAEQVGWTPIEPVPTTPAAWIARAEELAVHLRAPLIRAYLIAEPDCRLNIQKWLQARHSLTVEHCPRCETAEIVSGHSESQQFWGARPDCR